jgi:hypothetical protein
VNRPEKVTKETKLSEIMQIPGAMEILSKHRVPCLFCPMASIEMGELAIGQIAEMYNLDADALVKDLNKKLAQKGDE